MTTAGRNDPCPCGSGRKYKDCCSPADVARGATPTSANTRDSAIAKLLTFAFQPAFDGDHSAAELTFWGNEIRNVSSNELSWLLESSDATIKYNSWFLVDWAVDGAESVVELFLEEPNSGLTPAERLFLERLSRAHLRLYEVQDVVRGHGVRVLDLWTGTRLFVIEKTATSQIVRWDLLGARVAPDGMGGNVFEGGLYLYPAEAKDEILREFRRLNRRFQRVHPDGDPATFFRNHGAVFNHLWLELVLFPKPPQVTTSEGDPLIFCRVVFDTPHIDDVRATLCRRPDVRQADEEHFELHEPAGDGERLVGTWSFEGERVVLEATSQERAARGRKWLERLVGDLVRYRATALETVDQAMNPLRQQRPVTAMHERTEADTEVVRALYDRHYQTWMDRPMPALGNRTPRAAAQTKLWRRRLVELLKRLENEGERAALAGRPAYDFAWLWKELGLDRP
jgi:hypothetical protein